MSDVNYGFDRARRRILIAGAGAALGSVFSTYAGAAHATANAVATHDRPNSDEALSFARIGDVITFDIGARPTKGLKPVLISQSLMMGGGQLIDHARSYMHARNRLNGFVADLGLKDSLFIAVKLYPNAGGIADAMSDVMDRGNFVQAPSVDVVGDKYAFPGIGIKQGLLRYVGMATNSDRQEAAMATVLKAENTGVQRVNSAFPPPTSPNADCGIRQGTPALPGRSNCR